MMASDGRIHMLEADKGGTLKRAFVSGRPMPESCNPRRVLSALEKLEGFRGEVSEKDAALLPLTPFERGYVLGVIGAMRAAE
jgi:hypothetical protein